MQRKRIAFIINSLAGGGAERVMTVLLAASKDRLAHYELSLVLLDDEPRAYPLPDWLPVHQLDARFSLPRSAAALTKLLRTLRPDATLSFLTRANVASVGAARLLGHRAVISERVNSSAHFGTGAKAALSKALVRLTYPNADHVITVSSGVSDDLAANFGVHRARITPIANPVDVEAIVARAAEPAEIVPPGRYIVAMGRMTRPKNHRLLIDAYARAGTDALLLLLGEGPERAALQSQVKALGLSGRVMMPGFVSNPFAVMARADAYVSASDAEGFPNGLVEAMALGLPVISTNCASGPAEILAGARREAITGMAQAAHGLLVPTGDADRLAQAIGLLDDSALRTSYGERARRRAADYGVARAANQYWDIMGRV